MEHFPTSENWHATTVTRTTGASHYWGGGLICGVISHYPLWGSPMLATLLHVLCTAHSEIGKNIG